MCQGLGEFLFVFANILLVLKIKRRGGGRQKQALSLDKGFSGKPAPCQAGLQALSALWTTACSPSGQASQLLSGLQQPQGAVQSHGPPSVPMRLAKALAPKKLVRPQALGSPPISLAQLFPRTRSLRNS